MLLPRCVILFTTNESLYVNSQSEQYQRQRSCQTESAGRFILTGSVSMQFEPRDDHSRSLYARLVRSRPACLWAIADRKAAKAAGPARPAAKYGGVPFHR